MKSPYLTGRPVPEGGDAYSIDYGLAAGPKACNAALDRDYRTALCRHAATLILVKALSYWPLLGLSTYRNDTFTEETWVTSGVAPNDCGLRPNALLEWPRRKVTNLAWRVSHGPLRWISGVHAVWLAGTVGALGAILLRRRRGPAPAGGRLFHAAWLTVPLAYYLSYLAATPSPEYRFMMPATVVVQVDLIVGVACWMATAARCMRLPTARGRGALGTRVEIGVGDLEALWLTPGPVGVESGSPSLRQHPGRG